MFDRQAALRRSLILCALALTGSPALCQTVLHTVRLGAPRAYPLTGFLTPTGAGDLDGDGTPDFFVAGTHAFSGASGTEIWRIAPAQQAGPSHGQAVAFSGDLDGDGVHDVYVGSRSGPRLYSGASGALLRILAGDGAFGYDLAALSDLNGDGIREMAFGAPNMAVNGGGDHITVFVGGPGSVVIRDGGGGGTLLRFGAAAGPEPGFGSELASLGDVNGDGFDDLAVSKSMPLLPGATTVSVHSGLDGTVLYTFASPGATTLAGLGDVDGDGHSDFLHGSWSYERVAVVSGATGAELFAVTEANYSLFGYSLAGVGDQNGDGIPDALIGAPEWSTNWGGPLYAHGPGFALLISGVDGSILQRFDGVGANEGLGLGVGSMGDVDGNGRRELLIGSAKRGPVGSPGFAALQVISM